MISRKQAGFTIVELLVVIVIIGILAAITIVAYNGIQNRARTSAAQSLAAQANKKVMAYQASEGSYPGDLATAGVTDTTDLQYGVNNSSSPATYCLTATNGNVSYFLSSTQPTPQSGGCNGHGQGGMAAITNLIKNTSATANTFDWAAIQSTGGASTGSRITGLVPPVPGVTTAYRTTLTAVPGTWWRVQNDPSPATTVTAGQSYTLSGWVRPSVGVTTAVIIIWENSTGGTVSESASVAAQTANTWQQRTVTAAAPAGAVTARFHFGATSGGVIGAMFDATAVMFTQSSTPYNFADGNTANWAWNGTPDYSTSTGPAL